MLRALALVIAALVAGVAPSPHHHRGRAHARVRFHRLAVPRGLLPVLTGLPPGSTTPTPPPVVTGTTPAPPPPVTTPTTPAPPPPLPSRTGVDEGEYYVHPAHGTLAAGPVELNATNFGMDDHDLTVEDADGHQLAQVYLVAGASAQVDLTLAPGTYRLYCSLYNGAHDQAGMHAGLVVASG